MVEPSTLGTNAGDRGAGQDRGHRLTRVPGPGYGLGVPAKARAGVAGKPFAVRLSPLERKKLDEAAAAAGLDAKDYLRAWINGGAVGARAGAPGASLVDAIDQAVARSDLEELEAVANILHKALIPLRKRAKADAAFEAGTPVVVIRVRPQRAR